MIGSQRAKTIAIASIGSGSVSIGLASFDKGKMTLLDSERRVLPLEERSIAHIAAIFKEQLADAARTLIDRQLAAHNPDVPDQLYCIIRAPWTEAKVVSAEKSFDNEETITESMIAALAREALDRAGVNKDFVEASATRILLNGYHTKNPESKRANHLALIAFISRCEQVIRRAAQEALGSVFSAHEPKLRSGTRAILETHSHTEPTLQNCLVLDVGEEGVAALVIRQGTIEREAYTTEGIRRILQRAIATATPDQTRAALAMVSRGEYSPASYAVVQTGFARMEPELAHVFGTFFAALDTRQRLPNDIMLLAPPDISGWLSGFFERIEFTPLTVTNEPFAVTSLLDDTGVHGSADMSLAFALINKEQADR